MLHPAPSPSTPRRLSGRGRFAVRAILWMLSISSAGLFAAEEKIATPAPAASSTASCLECHSDATLTMRKQKRDVPLFVDQAKIGKSVHSTLDCIDCHEGFDGEAMPHKKPMTPANCVSCHEDMANKHAFHANFAGETSTAAGNLACAACHGTHETVKMRSPLAPFAPKQQIGSCGK